MRVILVSSIYPPDIGGPATFVPEFVDFLERANHSVTVLTLGATSKVTKVGNSARVHFIRRTSNRMVRMFKTVYTLTRLFSQNDFLLCNGLYFETAIALKFRPLSSTAKVVGDLAWERYKNRGGNLAIKSFNDSKIGFKARAERSIFTWSLSQFDQIYSPSRDLSGIIDSWSHSFKAYVIENGVECESETLTDYVKSYDVVTVCRLVPWKNIDLLIRACNQANLSLVVVGEGPERLSLERLSKFLGANVTFLGQLAGTRVKEILRISKIFALVSSYEGQSFALVEAMMAAKPILVSRIPGNVTVIQEGATGLFCELDLNDIAEKLEVLTSQNGTSERLGQAARDYATRYFCKDSQMEKTMNFIMHKDPL